MKKSARLALVAVLVLAVVLFPHQVSAFIVGTATAFGDWVTDVVLRPLTA